MSIIVTTATMALWLKHRRKHISSRGPYMSSRKAANSESLLSPYKSRNSLHLWNDTSIFILDFFLAWSSSLFLHCFSSSVFLFLLFYMCNGGVFFGSVVVVCSPPCLQFELEHIWPGKSRQPQTEDFYTAHLYLIPLSDHNDNFSKYNKKMVTDYGFN